MVLVLAAALHAPAGDIPFPDALEEANVSLSSMTDGQGESLMLGNGDLYGIVWQKGSGLCMRITKNDIWDARIDTSKDGPVPRVDVKSRKVTGSTGAPPSYKLPYPHPRCATGLTFGPTESAPAFSWRCIRGATKHSLTPTEDESGATMTVSGRALESTGYQVVLPPGTAASSLSLAIEGAKNTEYYIDVFNKTGKNVYASKWTPSPAVGKQLEIALPNEALRDIILYTRTLDGNPATNLFSKLVLQPDGKALALGFRKPARIDAHLDLRKAVASIKHGDAATEVRILHDRNVVLINSPHSLTLDPIKTATLPDARVGKTGDVDWLVMNMPGDVDYKGMDYAVAIAGEGHLKAVSLVTSFDIDSRDVLKDAIALAEKTIAEQETGLIAQHERAWEQFWSRSGVELADKDLQNWWFRMLYFAKTVCKPGAAPVALMPPLATDATPWHADYHHNYNAWQAFWPLPAANQAELADPWIGYVDDLLPKFKYLAKDRYGIDGACFPISSFIHEPDPTTCESKNQRQIVMGPWGLTIGMGGMTLQSMWHKHLCKPDIDYMRSKIYPTLKEVAKFYVAFMERCETGEDGRVLLGPSYSPEHGAVGIDDCPFDIGYVAYAFDAFIQASEELKTDEALAARCRKYKALLPDYPTAVDKDGKRVVVDWRGCGYRQVSRHNIEVPTTPVFPCDQVTWFSPEDRKALFRHTIRDTQHTGNNSHVMINIAKARLSMPEAVPDAKAFFLPRTLPNGFIRMPWAHGTFMQEMIGVVGLVNEFLMQSVGNTIRLFPCWPKVQDAKFTDLRAQGGFLVSAEQRDGAVTRVEITSTVGGRLRVLNPWTNEINERETTRGDSFALTAAGEEKR
jgi:hypothetical protein